MKYLISLIIIIFIIVFCVYQNNHIDISIHHYIHKEIPDSMNHVKILQISDFHNKQFSNKQKQFLDKVNYIDPDFIVITGDLIDRRRFDLEPARCLIEGLSNYQVFYVPGNHEAWSERYRDVRQMLTDHGVVVLENDSHRFNRMDDSIEIVGLLDLAFYNEEHASSKDYTEFEREAKDLKGDEFQILLSHRPDQIDVYQKNGYNLVFSGHAHGGQIRVPFIGPLFAPNQGVFPKYTEGMNRYGDTTMVVSRGIGNSLFPIRIFNHPELVVVTLSNK